MQGCCLGERPQFSHCFTPASKHVRGSKRKMIVETNDFNAIKLKREEKTSRMMRNSCNRLLSFSLGVGRVTQKTLSKNQSTTSKTSKQRTAPQRDSNCLCKSSPEGRSVSWSSKCPLELYCNLSWFCRCLSWPSAHVSSRPRLLKCPWPTCLICSGSWFCSEWWSWAKRI